MGRELTFVLDGNLGFPVEDAKWQEFFSKYQIRTVIYDDLKTMTEELEKNISALAFLPAANFYFFRCDSYYDKTANALFASNGQSQMSSLLIVSKDSEIDDVAQLKGKGLGCINFYCTSSYFAPAILLWRDDQSIRHFFSEIKEVGAWQLQIDAVIAGKVAATMIEADIWHKLPSNAEKTKIIGQVDHLPSPLILTAQGLDAQLMNEFKTLLFSYRPKVAPGAMFDGFVPYQQNLVETFYAEAAQAFS